MNAPGSVAISLSRHDDPAAFWTAARAFLERDDAANTHVLAFAARHAADPGPAPPVGWIVADDSGPIAAALLTRRGALLPTRAGRVAVAALIEAAHAEDIAITDVIAEQPVAESAARALGATYRVHVAMQLYRLDAVLPVPAVPGIMRQATAAEFDLLCRWQRDFFVDIGARDTVEDPVALVRRRLDDGGAWLWDVGGTPVVHAGHRPTPVRSARVAPVYTPPEHRGRGYATALVAALGSKLLDEGVHPVYLFADMANPTSNGVYRRVGFRPVGDHLHLVREDVA